MAEAVEKARKDPSLPQDVDVPIKALAAVCPKYWPEKANQFRLFIIRTMTDKQRADLKIEQPRQQTTK